MGKVLYSLSVSLDGFVETTEHSLDWVHVDEELHSAFNDESRTVSAMLFGRRMYELLEAYWPTADHDPAATPAEVEFGRIWNATPKIVFSDSLEEVGSNATLVRGDAIAEVARLKARPGFDMGVGGATFAGTLIKAELVDEFHLYVHPVLLGAGTPFFPELERPLELRLIERRDFSGGIVSLRYEPISAPD